MAISIDSASAVPPYDQIRSQLAAQIANGQLIAGTHLPTVRQLASELGVAVNTVARSYKELEGSGLVETRGRAGTVVTASGNQARERVLAAAQQFAELARQSGLAADEALRLVTGAIETAMQQ